MREVALDTETTGRAPGDGHRVVEIACIELENHIPTGREYQQYINPGRDMPPEAFAVHGLSAEFLAGFPAFRDIVDKFLEFIGDDTLVIHNAEFDIGFLDAELARIDRPPLGLSRALDTLALARRRFPGARASLDALCRRFDIGLEGREKHGALVDTDLLARVYLELLGGAQHGLGLDPKATPGPADSTAAAATVAATAARPVREPRPHAPGAEELAAHEAFLEKLRDPLWRKAAGG